MIIKHVYHSLMPYSAKRQCPSFDRAPLGLTSLNSLRLYPALPYMERLATKHDVIPLRKPTRTKAGTMVNEVTILPGQVTASDPLFVRSILPD